MGLRHALMGLVALAATDCAAPQPKAEEAAPPGVGLVAALAVPEPDAGKPGNAGRSADPPPAAASRSEPDAGATTAGEGGDQGGVGSGSSSPGPRIVRFAWKPALGPSRSYDLADPEDQHALVLMPGVERGGKYPVLLGFHGQYAAGKPPREYRFPKRVLPVVEEMVASGRIPPVVVALPVFRFAGQNWPGFDPRSFKAEIERILRGQGIRAAGYYAFGHSGAAGCGGEGLNAIHEIRPRAVAFFDTCVGGGWRDAIQELRRLKIPVVDLRSVETAAFRPRHRPEYDSSFDFGQVYAPLGIEPIECPAHVPGPRLRDQKYRCAATSDGLVRAFVVDTGPGDEVEKGLGEKAHGELVPVALRFFLEEFLSTDASRQTGGPDRRPTGP